MELLEDGECSRSMSPALTTATADRLINPGLGTGESVNHNQFPQPQQTSDFRLALRPVNKFLNSSDEDSDSNDDEDDDDASWKRKKTKGPRSQNEDDHPQGFLNAWQQQKAKERQNSEARRVNSDKAVKNALQSPTRSPRNDVGIPGNTPSNSPKMKRKKNNVWGTVVQDQVLEQGMQQSVALFKNVDDDDDRGVESYDFEKAQEDTRAFSHPGEVDKNGDELFEVSRDSNDPFQKLLEAEGLGTCEDKQNGDEDEDETTREKRHHRKRTRDDVRRGNGHNIPARDRLGPREFDTTKTCTEEDDEETVIDVIQNRLQEPKKHLIVKVVTVMGKCFALKMMNQTEDIEANGGMMTADNNRRRTPGGVLMQLVKTDPALTKEQKKEIFDDDRKLLQLKKKEMRRRAGRNIWRQQNEAEAMQLADKWKEEMSGGGGGDVDDEFGDGNGDRMDSKDSDTITSAATNGTTSHVSVAPKAAVAAVDDEFGDDGFCDIDAGEETINGGGPKRRTPSPVDNDIFG